MRTDLSIPLLGAAILTLGALALRLGRAGLGCARRKVPPPAAGPAELVERLRSKGL